MAAQPMEDSPRSPQTSPWTQMGISEYLTELAPKQQQDFRASFGEMASLSDVLSTLRREHGRAGSYRRALFIHKIEKLSQPLQQFSTALDIAAQTKAITSLVWGPLKAVILVAKVYADILDMIARVLEEIAAAIIRFLDYEDLLPDSPTIRSVLTHYYTYLIRFLVRTYKICTSRRGIFLRRVLQPLKVEMERAIQSVIERSQKADMTALLADMKSSRNERALQAEKFTKIWMEL